MLDDLRMTNSTFIEGYTTNGSLHYAPYINERPCLACPWLVDWSYNGAQLL
jgi:hypothetical protein